MRTYFIIWLLAFKTIAFGQFFTKYHEENNTPIDYLFENIQTTPSNQIIVYNVDHAFRIDQQGNISKSYKYKRLVTGQLEDEEKNTYLASFVPTAENVLQKLDSNNQVLWTDRLDYLSSDYAFVNGYQLSHKKESNHILVQLNTGIETSNILSLSTLDGSLIWDKKVPNILGVRIIDNGDYIYFLGQSLLEGYILKLSPQGNIVWEKKVKGVNVKDIKVLPSNDIIISGVSAVKDDPFMIILRMNPHGEILWSKKWLTRKAGVSITSYRANVFNLSVTNQYIWGTIQFAGETDIQFYKLSPTNGNIQFARYFLSNSYTTLNAAYINNNVIFKTDFQAIRMLPFDSIFTDSCFSPICIFNEKQDHPVIYDVSICVNNNGLVISETTNSLISNSYFLLTEPTTCLPITPNPAFIADTVYCVGDEFRPVPSSIFKLGTSYWLSPLWPNDTIIGTNPYFPNIVNEGTFFVKHQLYTGGCLYEDSIQISVRQPSIDIAGDSILCPNDTIWLTASSDDDASVVWNTLDTGPEIPVDSEGLYKATATDSLGCMASDSLFITAGKNPEILLPDDLTICDASLFEIVPTAASGSITWSDQSVSPTYITSKTGIYTAQTETVCGMAIDSIQVTFKNCEVGVFVPNAFSPNHDAYNDFLEVFTQNATVLEINIFDRLGNLVYAHKGAQPMWDGQFRNKPANIGVYAYILKYRNDLSGAEVYLAGDVTLIR